MSAKAVCKHENFAGFRALSPKKRAKVQQIYELCK